MMIRALERDGPTSRFAFAVSRGVGNAVIRNKVKRRLREAVRSLSVVAGWDVVVSARPAAAGASFAELWAEVEAQLRRAGLLVQEPCSS